MIAQNMLKTIGMALNKASTPPEEAMPDFSIYEGNYESRPWGGEVAIRQWGKQLVVIDLPTEDLAESMIKLEHDSNHTFIRLTEDEERREPWVFELGDDGNTTRIFRHSIYLNRIE
ncbi:MAG: hypothetical protein V3R56_05990 [Xanthomonadales bacterium]